MKNKLLILAVCIFAVSVNAELLIVSSRTGKEIPGHLTSIRSVAIIDSASKQRMSSNPDLIIEPDIVGEPREVDSFLEYDAFRRVPWEGNPAMYARDTYTYYATNRGVPINLYQNGILISSVPANTNASIGLIEAWNICSNASGGGVVVALIDSGMNYLHPDLQGVIHQSQIGNTNLLDVMGHGTGVAGVIGALMNGEGIVGVAPGVSIMVEKTTTYALSEIIAGIDHAISGNAKIINCSWGFGTNSPALFAAFKAAEERGIIAVAAALNSPVDYNSNSVRDYPIKWRKTDQNAGGLKNLIAVTSTMPDDRILSGGAAWGNKFIDFGAPGHSIPTTGIGTNLYVYANGTSIACGITSGGVALLWTCYPDESMDQILFRIRHSTDSVPDLSEKSISSGRINVYKALTMRWPLLSIAKDDSVLHIRATGLVPGVPYSLESTTDLVSWTNLDTLWSTNAVCIDAPSGSTFYRLKF